MWDIISTHSLYSRVQSITSDWHAPPSRVQSITSDSHAPPSHVRSITSDSNASTSRDPKLSSIISVALTLCLFPSNLSCETTYSNFQPLTTCPNNVDSLFLIRVTHALCHIFITLSICSSCSQHSSNNPGGVVKMVRGARPH